MFKFTSLIPFSPLINFFCGTASQPIRKCSQKPRSGDLPYVTSQRAPVALRGHSYGHANGTKAFVLANIPSIVAGDCKQRATSAFLFGDLEVQVTRLHCQYALSARLRDGN